MPRWKNAALVSECPPGAVIEVVVASTVVALANVQGKVYAMDGVCPHQGGPLGKGRLTGCILTCPWHGWQFDVRNGRYQLSSHLAQRCFPARIKENRIQLDTESLPGAN